MTKSTEYRKNAAWVKETAKQLQSPNIIVAMQCAEHEVKMPSGYGRPVDDKVMAYGFAQGVEATLEFIRNMGEPHVDPATLQSTFEPEEPPKRRR